MVQPLLQRVSAFIIVSYTETAGLKGGITILRGGAGTNGPMRTLGQYMLGSGLTFGYAGEKPQLGAAA